MTIGIVLCLLFFIASIILITVGIWLTTYEKRTIEVNAECVDISTHSMKMNEFDMKHYNNLKQPSYHYWYEGKEYYSEPILSSNRKNYQPQLGTCTIRINPNKPNKVYFSERKLAGYICFVIGIVYIVIVIFIIFILKKLSMI